MLISQLISELPIQIIRGDATIAITDVYEDSRHVSPGSLFIARSGTATDGSSFITDAIASGATAVLCTKIPETASEQVTWLTSETVDTQLTGQLAERYFDHPSQKLKLIGITGTNGKTTTAYLTRRLLRQSGVMCGMIGTIEIDDGINRNTAQLTTPGSVELSRLLAKMVANGCTAAVMEVSSHALDQGRASAMTFHAAVFTNLTGDHLDYHGSMANYATAKAKLFEGLGPDNWAILNTDDPYSQEMIANSKARQLWCRVCDVAPVESPQETEEQPTFCTATILKMSSSRSYTRMAGPWGSYELDIPLIGKHNLYNTIQAIAAANTVTSVARKLRPTLEQAKGVPGRLELVRVDEDASEFPAILVDYAHTHDALENVLSAIKPLCEGRLITVFGCGGDRDESKRPKMAKIACDFSDIAIITSDNPRTENPFKIIEQIQAGVPKDTVCDVRVIDDRRHAIEQAIALAGEKDTILIAGKGHEDYQIVGTEKIHFDDRQVAREYLYKGVGTRQ